MTLTVPMAGDTGGRAAQLQYEVPQTGAVLAGFGDAVKQIGDRLENQRLDKEMTELQLGMTHDINQLRLKYEAMGDPEAIDKGWATDIQALKSSYLTGSTDTGRPRVDPKIRSQFGMQFDDLAERHAFALGSRNLAIRQSQTVAAGIAYSDEAAKQAATTDAGTREEIYRQNDARIDREVRQGLKMPDQGAREKIEFRARGDANAAFQMLQNDPRGLIEHLDAGELQGLSAEDRTSYRARAENQLRIAADKAASEADVASRAADDAAKARLKDGIVIMGKGGAWDGEAQLADPALAAKFPDLVAEAQNTQALRNEGKPILRMTRAELEAEITTAQSAKYSQPWQMKRLDTLKARLADYDTAWTRDPIAAATAADLPVPPLAPFDPANPQAFASSLAARQAFAGWAADKGYVGKDQMRLMSDAEAASLKPALASTADPVTRTAAASALAALPDGKGDGIAAAAGASDAFRFGMGMLARGSDPSLVAAMMRGEARIDTHTVAMPPEKDMLQQFDTLTSGVFADDPQERKRAFAASSALYADQARGIDPETIKSGNWLENGAAQEAFQRSVQEAFGASPDGSGALTIGGLQPIRDRMIPLPAGVSGPQFDKALDTVKVELSGYNALSERPAFSGATLAPEPGPATKGPAPLAQPDIYRSLKAASLVPDRYPDLGPHPASTWENLRVEPAGKIGEDAYVLIRSVAGTDYIVTDQKGQEYYFSAATLNRSVVRP